MHKTLRTVIFTAGLSLAGLAVQAVPCQAAALAKACAAKPSALPKAKCICIEHELRKVLSPEEMRIEILAFRGKYSTLRKKVKAMNKSKAQSFERRVNSVLHGKICNR